MGQFNYFRKMWHLLGFIFPILLYFDVFKGAFGLVHASRVIVLTGIFSFTILVIIGEVIRFSGEAGNKLFMSMFGKIMKIEESHNLNATIPFMISNFLVVLFFPSEIVFLSMIFLLIGDPAAAFFGSKYGKVKFYNGKSLAGLIGFIDSSIIAGFLLLYIISITKSESSFALYNYLHALNVNAVIMVIVGAIAASLTEFFSGHSWKGVLDDNLTIPIVAAIAMIITQVVLTNSNFNNAIFPVGELLNK